MTKKYKMYINVDIFEFLSYNINVCLGGNSDEILFITNKT